MKNLLLSISILLLSIQISAQFAPFEAIISVHETFDVHDQITLDWNDDGLIDIICMGFSESENYWILYFNLGNGSFSGPETVWIDEGYIWEYTFQKSSIRWIDMNGDGLKELVFFSGDNLVFIPIESEGLYASPQIQYIYEYTVSWWEENWLYDFDEDGDQDIVIFQSEYDLLTEEVTYQDRWLVNDGDFEFVQIVERTFLPITGNVDLDNDGDRDYLRSLAVNYAVPNAFSYRENMGGNTFGPLTQINLSSPGDYYTEDFNNDGLTDICYLWGDQFSWIENLGNLQFGAAQSHTLANYLFPPIHFVILDENNDGNLDMVYRTGPDSDIEVHILYNDGTGNFNESIMANNEDVHCALSGTYADFNSDGNIDCVGSDDYNSYSCDLAWKSDFKHNLYGEKYCLKYFYSYHCNPLIEDFTQDGLNDVLIKDYDFGWYLKEGSGNGTFDNPVLIDENINATLHSSLFSENINADPKPEIIEFYYNQDESLQLNISQYNPIDSSIVSLLSYTTSIDYYINNVQFIDLNDDGLIDIFTTGHVNGLTNSLGDVFFNQGNNSFTEVAITSEDFFSNLQSLQIADIDGDGAYEMIFATSNMPGLYKVPLNINGSTGATERISNLQMNFINVLGTTGTGNRPILASGYSHPVNIAAANANSQYEVIESISEVLQDNNSGAYYMSLLHYLTSGDIDNDNTNEVLSSNYQNSELHITTFINGIVGTNLLRLNIPYFTLGNGEYQYYLKDVDGDNYADLVMSGYGDNYNGQTYWSKNSVFNGCADPTACNYNPTSLTDDGSCCYLQCGCKDSTACNYNVNATCDDGSCQLSGCTDLNACNYDPLAVCDDGSCSIFRNLIVRIEKFGNEVLDFHPEFRLYDSDFSMAPYISNVSIDQDTITSVFKCILFDCWNVELLTTLAYVDSTTGFNMTISDNFGNTLEQENITISDYATHSNSADSTIGIFSPVRLTTLCLCYPGSLPGCTDEQALNYNPEAQCEDGTCIKSFAGRVFFDENLNGILDSSDYGLGFQELIVFPGNITLITNNDGFFNVNLTPGQYTIHHVYDEMYPYYSTESIFYIYNSTGNFQTDPMIGLTIAEPLFDICIDIYPDYASYVCNGYVNFNLCFRNMGNVPISGVMTLQKDSLFSAFNMVTPIDSINGDLIYFSYDSLMPGEMFFYDIELLTPTFDFLGQTLINTVSVSGIYDNENVAFGYVTRYFEHACSYDPNDKIGEPFGFTEYHFVEDGTAIEYLIRFQNTGTAAAHDVLITDAIDENLNMESLRIVANSHSVMSIINEESREVQFYFQDIELPDSSSNEPASHGLISYRVNIKPDLMQGTAIHNTANIYFDNNPAVVTNTTLHTIFDCDTYSATFSSTLVGDCSNAILILEAPDNWTDQFSWLVDNEVSSDSSTCILTETGLHHVVLFIENALCGVRIFESELDVQALDSLIVMHDSTYYCSGSQVILQGNTDGNNQWYINDILVSTESELAITTGGTYALVITENGCTTSYIQEITYLISPEYSEIIQNGNTLSVPYNPDYTYYWDLNQLLIPGATNPALEITQSGEYTLTISNGDCAIQTGVIATYIGVEELQSLIILCYPNPTNDYMIIEIPQVFKGSILEFYSSSGQLIWSKSVQSERIQLDTTKLPQGVYNLRLSGDKIFETKSVLVTH
jgi:uncharacterized repeat protein (TIGR01451 family)